MNEKYDFTGRSDPCKYFDTFVVGKILEITPKSH